MTDPGVLKRLAGALPDIPRWLETRSMLLSGSCDVFGLAETPETSFVARDRAFGLVCVVGAPGAHAIREAVALSAGRGVLVCQLEDQEHVVAALPDWPASPASLHLMGDASRLPRLLSTGPGGMIVREFVEPKAIPVPVGRAGEDVVARFLSHDEMDLAPDLPPDLRAELEIAFLVSRVAATLVGGRPGSFCYSASVTESLWDISIDTLESYRRKGYAAL